LKAEPILYLARRILVDLRVAGSTFGGRVSLALASLVFVEYWFLVELSGHFEGPLLMAATLLMVVVNCVFAAARVLIPVIVKKRHLIGSARRGAAMLTLLPLAVGWGCARFGICHLGYFLRHRVELSEAVRLRSNAAFGREHVMPSGVEILPVTVEDITVLRVGAFGFDSYWYVHCESGRPTRDRLSGALPGHTYSAMHHVTGPWYCFVE
jgi:hypothetical protein